MVVRPTLASSISLKSARARCHWPRFWHALTAVLQLMDGVGLQLCLPHLAEQRKNLPPKPNFLAGAHGSVVADEAGLQFRLPHLAEQQQSLVPPPAFLTCADPGAVAD
ncbi:unnamed protein product [Prorocentrum cordatum]|uniref:Uncharacterized protein n=1 Tax=Prorocentrum cordatum TaxID=2364126 RepID=A0ABN9WWN1_9DINO|nr:unnamed protein product [Polarella glacialis]